MWVWPDISTYSTGKLRDFREPVLRADDEQIGNLSGRVVEEVEVLRLERSRIGDDCGEVVRLERRHLEREDRPRGMPEEVHAPAGDRLLAGDLVDDVVQQGRAVLGRSPVDGIVRVGPDDDDFLFLGENLPGRDVRLAALARTVKRHEQRQLPLRCRSRRDEEKENSLLPLPGNRLL